MKCHEVKFGMMVNLFTLFHLNISVNLNIFVKISGKYYCINKMGFLFVFFLEGFSKLFITILKKKKKKKKKKKMKY